MKKNIIESKDGLVTLSWAAKEYFIPNECDSNEKEKIVVMPPYLYESIMSDAKTYDLQSTKKVGEKIEYTIKLGDYSYLLKYTLRKNDEEKGYHLEDINIYLKNIHNKKLLKEIKKKIKETSVNLNLSNASLEQYFISSNLSRENQLKYKKRKKVN